MAEPNWSNLVRRLIDLPHETPFCEFKKGWFDAKNIGTLVSALSEWTVTTAGLFCSEYDHSEKRRQKRGFGHATSMQCFGLCGPRE